MEGAGKADRAGRGRVEYQYRVCFEHAVAESYMYIFTSFPGTLAMSETIRQTSSSDSERPEKRECVWHTAFPAT